MKSKNIPSLSFQPVSVDKVKDIIKTLNTKKACRDSDMPVKLTTFSKFQCGFRKGFSTQNCLLYMIEIGKNL